MFLLGFRVVYRTVVILGAAAIVYVIICGVQVETASRHVRSTSSLERAAAIVVTGNPGSTDLSSDYRHKLRLAASLYSNGRAPLFVVALKSGSGDSGSLPRRWARAFGSVTKASAITTVTASNARAELARVERRVGHGRRVIVVTDAINTLYLEGLVSNLGLKPEVVAPSSSRKILFAQIAPLFREASGVAVARVFGYAVASWAS